MSESKRQSIKLTNVSTTLSEGEIVIRGLIAPDSIHLINIGPYQREVLGGKAVEDLKEASIRGKLPEIDLGMRGENFLTKGENIFLQDPVFVIDGLQRQDASLGVIKSGKVPILNVCVWLNTTEAIERERFQKLNVTQRKVSANVTLKNCTETSKAMKMLYRLSMDESFILADKVSWGQTKKVGELMTARNFVLLAIQINYRVGNHFGNVKTLELPEVLERIIKDDGQKNVRHNIKYFFAIVDAIWNIGGVRTSGSMFMRVPFLTALALFFARHKRFWTKGELFVDKPTQEKLLTFFDSYDLTILNTLTLGGVRGGNTLYTMLVDHYNSGKRNGRIVADI